MIEARPTQLLKAPSPIVVTPIGIWLFVHPSIKVFEDVSMIALQLLRESYTLFSLSTIIEVKLLHPSNTPTPMVFTLLGMNTLANPKQLPKEWAPIELIPSERVTFFNSKQSQKAKSPIFETLKGILTESNPVHPKNAPFPMLITLEGMSTDDKLTQSENA